MIKRIEVKSKGKDTRANSRLKVLRENFPQIKNISLTDVYTINKELNSAQLDKASSALSNPVTQEYYFDFIEEEKFDWAVEIGFLPGVTDNLGSTAKEIIEDLLKINFKGEEGVYTSQINFLTGKLSEKEIQKIAESIANSLIQRIHIKSFSQYKADLGMDKIIPLVKLDKIQSVIEVDLNVGDEELIAIGKFGIKNPDNSRRGPLALDLTYMKTIQAYFKESKRNPTDIELETIAQTWSEHCKHTIFADPLDEIKRGLFKTFIKDATEKVRKSLGREDFCVSVFTDNSGAIEFDENYLITHKTETHNSPSALDPFGGAVTGIVGVNRDALGFGLGAKPVINTYGFCLSDPNDEKHIYRDQGLTQKMLSPRRILEGVVSGINTGGNQSGIPSPQGFLYFDQSYKGKPLVFAGTVGLIPKKVGKRNSWEKKAQNGDLIVMVGGRVGLDGVHGATFSSESLDTRSPAAAVQIGDPITQKKFSDALIKEVRDLDLYNSITDNGAGGLSSSVGEMAKESGGCEVYLEKVPLKYPGLDPWQIWISESQERMTLAVPRKNWKKLSELLEKRGVEVTAIGKFTNSKKCVVKFKDKTVMEMDLEFLHNGNPKKLQKSSLKLKPQHSQKLPELEDYTRDVLEILSRPSVGSFEFVSTQYDHEVQAGSVLKPLQGKGRVNSETSVTRPLLGSQRGIALSQSLYPKLTETDPYLMAANSIDTAIRNLVVVGADPKKIALLDNFCWSSSNDPERLGLLKETARGCFDFAVSFNAPFISGKDSMFNDFNGYDDKGLPIKISVLPTLLISSISVINDITKTVSLDVKFPGDLIYVLGETFDELAGSEYLQMKNINEGKVPVVNALKNKNIYNSLFKAIQKDLIASSISITRGGLGVALSKMSIAGNLGIDVNLQKLKGKINEDYVALFSQSSGRIVVTINPESKSEFEKIMKGSAISEIGTVINNAKFLVKGINGKEIINTNIEKLNNSYRRFFKEY